MQRVFHRPSRLGRGLLLPGLIFGAFFVIFIGVWRSDVKAEHITGHASGSSGFFWSDTFGWFSANCQNDWNGDGSIAADENRCAGSGSVYGIEVDTLGRGGTLSGFAWSPNLGLVCFGSDCSGATPDGGEPNAQFEFGVGENVAEVQGWARVEGHQNERGVNQGGWIRLNGTSPGATPVSIVARVIDDEGGQSHLEFSGSGWQRNQDGSGVGWGVGWVDVDVSDAEVPLGVEPCPEREEQCRDGVNCCANGIDDDCDASYTTTDQRDVNALTGRDCQDYDCTGAPCPQNERLDAAGSDTPAQCFDGVDNDLDAFVRNETGIFVQVGETLLRDCGDPDCSAAVYIDGEGVVHRCASAERDPGNENFCDDDLDNDNDGLVDCADLDCAEFITCNPDNLCQGHERNPGEVSCPADCADNDGDLVCDDADNCLNLANPTQSDRNDNGIGDLCDAFLQTQQGVLYGRGFRSPAAPPVPSATFCILSSGQIVNFTTAPVTTQSGCGLPPDDRERLQEFRLRQYGDTLALWSDALRARMDLAELRAQARSLPTADGRIDWNALGAATTGGQIFYYRVPENEGALVIDAPIVWQNGTRLGTRTILIEGNVIFAASSRYVSPSESLRALASVAWIVVDNPETSDVIEGNISIDPEVGGDPQVDLVGAYIASGAIRTGTRGTPPDLQLKVRGLMAAKSFGLERQYRPPEGSPQEGAELIIYDGRATLNPPAGLSDFVKGLPATRAIVPQR